MSQTKTKRITCIFCLFYDPEVAVDDPLEETSTLAYTEGFCMLLGTSVPDPALPPPVKDVTGK